MLIVKYVGMRQEGSYAIIKSKTLSHLIPSLLKSLKYSLLDFKVESLNKPLKRLSIS